MPSLLELIPFLQQYPAWVRYLLALIIAISFVFVMALLFAKQSEQDDAPFVLMLSPYEDEHAQVLGDAQNAFLIASGVEGESYYHAQRRQTVFSAYLLDGLSGAADLNRDGLVTITELQRYVRDGVAGYARSALIRGLVPPITVGRGDAEVALLGSQVPFKNGVGVFLGLSDYDDHAYFDHGGAQRVIETLDERIGLRVESLVGGDATRVNALRVLSALPSRVTNEDLLVIVFAGYARIGRNGHVQWLLYSPDGDDYLDATEIAEAVRRAGARYSLVIVDCSVGGEFGQRSESTPQSRTTPNP